MGPSLHAVLVVVCLQLGSAAALLDRLSTNNSLLVVSVGMQDGTGISQRTVFPACDAACMRSTLAGDVARVLNASSGGKFGLSLVSVVGVPIAEVLMQSECHMGDRWYRAALAQVPNATAYDARMFVFPQSAGAGTCTVGGFSTQGCTLAGCSIWLRGFGAALVVHELGHLLGFSHAAWDADGDLSVGADEASADLSDPMTSVGAPRLFHAAHRVFAEWMPCDRFGFPGEGKVLLHSSSVPKTRQDQWQTLCRNSPQPAVLNLTLIVSARTPHGPDAAMETPWAPAVYVHSLNTQTGATWCLAILHVGETAVVQWANTTVYVTALSVLDTAFTVTFAKCLRSRPVLAGRALRLLSKQVNVTVMVKNTDMYCPGRRVVVRELSGAARCQNITVILAKDNSPAEMSVEILLTNGSGAVGTPLLPRTPFTATGPSQAFSVLNCQGEAVVWFFDAFGDGYCCDWGPGGFQVLVNGALVASGARFGFNTSVNIPGSPVWTLPGLLHPGHTGTVAVLLASVPLGVSRLLLGVEGT